MYLICPVCDHETIRVDPRHDSDPLHEFIDLWFFPECQCELTDEQMDALDAEARKLAEVPSYDEP